MVEGVQKGPVLVGTLFGVEEQPVFWSVVVF